jgi:transcriptional regulator with XRE-family HTH domain
VRVRDDDGVARHGDNVTCGEHDVGLTLGILRLVRGWNQDDLAQASGVRNAAISDYERGKKSPELKTLRRLLDAMGFGMSVLDHTRQFVGLVRLEGLLGARGEGGGVAAAAEEAASAAAPAAAEVEVAAGTAAAALRALARMAVALAQPSRQGQGLETALGEARRGLAGGTAPARAEDRAAAVAVWEEMAALPAAELQRRACEEGGAARWAVCERVCEESIAAAARDAAQGVRLAEAAVAVAERVSGPEAWRCRVRGYALAHLANARRVQGELPAAEEAMAAALSLWERGVAAADDLLDEARVLGLEASLRRAQRRFEESLVLLDRALAAGASRRSTAVHLINKASTLEEMGRVEEAIGLLRFTAPLVDGEREPRLRFCVESNLADLLSKAERYEEAAGRLPEAKRLARLGGRELDLVRLRWTEGRIAAGLGEVGRGAELLSKVRGELASRGIAYDTALVTLELAVLYAGEGRTAEVKALARHLVPMFRNQALPAGAMAALMVFRKAAERERVTVELAREIGGYLVRARKEPGIRCERQK